MSNASQNLYGGMTNAADTYYGTLFSNLSYGMGENGGTGLATNPISPTNPTSSLSGTSTGHAEWVNSGGYPAAMINEWAATAAARAVQSGGGSAGIPVASSAVSNSYTATVLAALAAAAAASYSVQPQHPMPPSNNHSRPTFAPTPNAAADYGAMFYRSRQPTVISHRTGSGLYAAATTNDVYPLPNTVVTNPTSTASGWSFSPAMMTNGTVAAAQWATNPQNACDLNQHLHQHAYPDHTRPPGDGSETEKSVPSTIFYTPSHFHSHASSMLPYTTEDQLGTVSFGGGTLIDPILVEQQASCNPDRMINGMGSNSCQLINGQPSMVDAFAQRQLMQQHLQLTDKLGRLVVTEDSGGEGTTTTDTGMLQRLPSVSVSCTHSDQPVRSQWQRYREQKIPNDRSSVDSHSHRVNSMGTSSSSTSAEIFDHTADVNHPMGGGGSRSKTWASIAGQPPRGSAAVLVGSTTGWSAKRVPGQVSQTAVVHQRASQSTGNKPSQVSSNGISHPVITSSMLRPVDNPTIVSTNGTNSMTKANYADDTDKLESEALYQCLAKSINPSSFDTNVEKARFFVIKSFSEDDIHRSIKYAVWCSTELGNKKLDSAFMNANNQYPIYLFYSVNGSGHFCGVAEMTSSVDYDTRVRVWAQDKWQGAFSVRWIFVKDVPNTMLRHIRVETNENKPVTHSRDTTELPLERGKQVLQVFANYSHKLSIFDDFMFYEDRERQDGRRKDNGRRG